MRRHGTISAAWCRSRRTSERRVAKAKPRRPSARRPRGPERYANREAATHLETALALGHPDVGGLQLALGEVRTALGDYPGAIAALETAAALATEARLATIELRLGRVHGRRGDLVTADSHLVAAQDLLAPAGGDASEALAGVLAERALVAHRSGDETAAIQLANRALEGVADPTPDGDLAARAARPLQILGLVALAQGDLPLARRQLGRSLRAAGTTDLAMAVASRHALALVEARSGDLDLAIELAGAALAEAGSSGTGTSKRCSRTPSPTSSTTPAAARSRWPT